MDFRDILNHHHAYFGDKLAETRILMVNCEDKLSPLALDLAIQIRVLAHQIALLDDLSWHYVNGEGWTWEPICALKEKKESDLN